MACDGLSRDVPDAQGATVVNAITPSGFYGDFDGKTDTYQFARSPVRQVNFGASDGGTPSFNFLNFDIANPANYIGTGLYQLLLKTDGTQVQARGDAQYDISDTGLLRNIQVGIRYSDRKASNGFGVAVNFSNPSPLSALPSTITC